MKLALSVRNPLSYLICYGIKDVENRTWTTDYRGTLYIHSCSSGADYVKLPEEFLKKACESYYDEALADLDRLDLKQTDYDAIVAHLNNIGRQDLIRALDYYYNYSFMQEKISDHYNMDCFAQSENPEADLKKFKEAVKKYGPYFISFAIIGQVDLVDIIRDSESPWAEPGQYHWVFGNPIIYDNPITEVKGRLRLFDVSHII